MLKLAQGDGVVINLSGIDSVQVCERAKAHIGFDIGRALPSPCAAIGFKQVGVFAWVGWRRHGAFQAGDFIAVDKQRACIERAINGKAWHYQALAVRGNVPA